jgi:hypothetical protein
MPWFPLILAVGIVAPLSPSDQAAMTALRQAVRTLENTQSQKQFERLVPRSKVTAWQRLQRHLPDPLPGSADLAFVLAYYGVDYQRNVHRLLRPYWRWRHSNAHPDATIGHDSEVVAHLPDDLCLLFLKHHDALSWGTLSDLRFDGDTAETRADDIYDLWRREPVRLLRVASRSRDWLGAVWEGIDWNQRTRGNRLAADIERLRRLSHHRDRRVAQAARTVMADLTKEFKAGDGG